MAPIKGTTRAAAASSQTAVIKGVLPLRGKGLSRRVAAGGNHNQNNIDPNMENMQTRGKRKADNSPIKNDKIKRTALGNLTNNVKIMTLHPGEEDQQQQQQVQAPKKPTAQQLQTLLDAKNNDNGNVFVAGAAIAAPSMPNKIMTRASSKIEDAVENCHKVLDKFEEALTRPKTRKSLVAAKKPMAMPMAMPDAVPQPLLKLPAPPPPPLPAAAAVVKPVRRISNDFNKTEESLYMSALEDISTCDSMRLSGNFEATRRRSAKLQQKTDQPTVVQQSMMIAAAAAAAAAKLTPVPPVPSDVEDFDRKNWDDPFQVSHYAMDIFNYLKKREPEFPIHDYMPQQVHLTTWMRTLLVDWMVEVQETFELNHETLYLAVKIVDLYLCRTVINKEKLQLLGAAAFFIACKYDERQPPLIEDFLYICDGAYNHEELVKMEMETLRTIKYDLGIPLSYRFLRRYARCANVQMPTLTLARYILELSLMDYATIGFSDSQMASAALFMALRMHGGVANVHKKTWSSTLIYYTGYQLADFAEIIPVLNGGLHRTPRATIKTIRNKYSHKIFHEVAKVPLLSNQQMFQCNLDLNDSNSCTG
ncbi:G2/mitotic-specific cyclin-B3 [Drosophila grimshawi]|uniref:GH16367 n=1 Tax=Drosophila grimshawi TaxID=7222 RepID=B4JU83_DROGR|nr:G2/mitotic-specific cyclin-B3 [Drosophila grimshawi]EDV91053.1 GH16367 [Drosophila grimshawi]